MPVKSEWYNQQRSLILQTYTGTLDLQLYKEGILTNKRLFNAVSHKVDVIVDSRGISIKPFSFIQAGFLAQTAAPDNLGFGVLVTDGKGPAHTHASITVNLGKSLGSKLAKNTHFAPNIEEAIKILNHLNAATV